MRWSIVAVALVILGLCTWTFAARAGAAGRRGGDAKAKSLNGTVIKVDGANLKIQTRARSGGQQEVVVPTDEKTVVTINGKERKLENLKQKMRVKVTPATGTASKIEARGRAAARRGAAAQ